MPPGTSLTQHPTTEPAHPNPTEHTRAQARYLNGYGEPVVYDD